MRDPRTRTLTLAALVAALALAAGLAACGSDGDDGDDLAAALEDEGVFVAEAGEQGEGTTEPSGSEALAELPKLTRGQIDQEQPTIRGSQGLSVAQWLQSVMLNVATFWQQSFAAADLQFKPVTYQIFTATVPTGCKDLPEATTQVGPLYCPTDQTVYLSVPYMQGFYGRIGDAALAIPVAHEVGHHIQNQIGILGRPDLRSIDLELMADCFAGVWAQSLFQRNLLEPGDVKEALASRIAVRDPKGTSPNDPQAHGTAKQRTGAFLQGYNTGLADSCV